MKNNQLIDTLSKISKKDFKEFHKYTYKNYEEKSAGVKILTYLKRYHPDFDRFELDPTIVFKKVFKGEEFSQRKINHALYDIRRYLKEFLIKKYFTTFPFERAITLKNLFESLGLKKPAVDQFKEMQTAIKKEDENDLWFWGNKLRLSHEYYYNNSLEKIANEGNKIEAVIEDLDNFYALAKLKYACEIYNRKEIINEGYKDILHLGEITKRDWSDISLLHNLYQASFNLITSREDQYYYGIKELVIRDKNLISQEDRHILITYLINHAAYHIKKGNHKFGKKIYELYKLKIQDGSFIVKGLFDNQHFVNIVDVAGALGEFQWTEQFINQFQDNLMKNTRETVLQLSFAIYHFWKKDFAESLKLLEKDYKKNIFFGLKSRLIRLSCKYELLIEYGTEHILDECKALENYIRRKDIAPLPIKMATSRYLKILKNLLSFQPNKDEIYRNLNNGEFIFYKVWLLQKIENLGEKG